MLVQAVEILLVEDNPGDVYLIREAFDQGQIAKNLHAVSDGEKALRFLKRKDEYRDAPRPDLIILDLNLPKLDGRQVLGAIKADEDWRRIPVVILSTSSAESDVLSSYEHHANCYLTKPSDLFQFLEVVKQIENYWLTYVRAPAF